MKFLSELIILLLIISSAVLHAYEENSTKLDKIVITATGFENALKNESKNVALVTEDEIENRGYRSLNEILQKSPGVSVINSGAGLSVDMRGQGSKSNTAVKVLVNGVGAMNMIDSTPNPIYTNLIPIEDIEQVEIIPGGGSVLYGNGTRGGVINIITKQKARAPYAVVSSKIGSYNYKDTVLNVAGNVTENLF